jgi:tetratricopeptide (TPR) repeat protein
LQEQGGESAVALLEQWSVDMPDSGQIQLLHTLCREAAPGVKDDPALLSRLALLDPSLAPSATRKEAVPTEIPPAAPPADTPPPEEDSHWEEDLNLAPELANQDHEDLLELEPMEDHPEGEFLLEEEAVDESTDEDMVPVTLTAADLSLQKWTVPEADRHLHPDEIPAAEDLVEVDELEPIAPDILSEESSDVEEAELFSEGDFAGFGDDLILAPMVDASQSSPDTHELDGLFNDFKSSVDSNVDEGDTETHFNLGIAYKEMGLLDDAIQSFAAASSNPDRRIDSIVLQGACYVDKGEMEAAERVLRGGLAECADGSEAACVLQYELAALSESRGAQDEALKLYEQVRVFDPFFRDVSERIATLGGKVDSLELLEVELVEE